MKQTMPPAPPETSNMQVSTRDTTDSPVSTSEDMPPYMAVVSKQLQAMHKQMVESEQRTTAAITDATKSMHSSMDEMRRGVNQASMMSAHAEKLTQKMASECHELRMRVSHMQHTIDAKDAQIQLWQMQSELDRPARAEKMNTVYIAPTRYNTSRTPFSSELLDYSQATVTTKANMQGGVEVKFANREESVDMLKQYPSVKNTQKPYRATYAKTPLQQRRDRLYTAIKQRLPRGITGYIAKGQLRVTTAPVHLAKKGEAPSDTYPSWLHAKTGPAGMNVSEHVNLEAVPEFARQVVELAEYEHKHKNGNNTHTTPIRSITDGGDEADISDVEMTDRVARGRRSPTGETPGAKRAATK